MPLSLLIRQYLGDGKFVATNSCREDIPRGTPFTWLSAELGELVDGTCIVKESKPRKLVVLSLASIEFWRKPWPCVPNGHHAGVMFDGDSVPELAAYVAEHPAPWLISLEAE